MLTLSGIDPNGVRRLFVANAAGSSGGLEGGWSPTIKARGRR